MTAPAPHPVDRELAAKDLLANPSTLRHLIVTDLGALQQEMTRVHELVDSRQPGFGFLTPAGKKAQADLIRDERKDRLRHAREGTKPTGQVAAPGSTIGFSLTAEYTALLTHIERRIYKRLKRARVGHIAAGPIGHDSTDAEHHDRVIALISVIVRHETLLTYHREIADLLTRVKAFADGVHLEEVPAPCPWCGHWTLIADLVALTVTCGRDPDTGEHETCLCSDTYCPCKTSPRSHRHTWHNSHRASQATSWYGLRRAIVAAEKAGT